MTDFDFDFHEQDFDDDAIEADHVADQAEVEALRNKANTFHEYVHAMQMVEEQLGKNPENYTLLALSPLDAGLIYAGFCLTSIVYPCLAKDVKDLHDRLMELVSYKADAEFGDDA